MKKLSTLMMMLFLGFGFANAEKTEDDTRYRGYSNSFIFTEGGIEFAIFPDGQFDFNYLDNGPQFGANANFGNVNISFNTGYNYDPFVQYDTYGAVIQIENTPVYYDGFGRIIQAGNVFINYRNGYVRNVGNLYVNYSRPGIILNYTGYINNFNVNYVYQPWHGFYAAPFIDRRIVYNRAYRTYYNPIRFDYSYHRNYWNTASYYNGCYIGNRNRRVFYRPNDRVVYRDYERGRRDNRGRLTTSRTNSNYRNSIASGRQSIARSNDNGRSSRNVASSVVNRRSTIGNSQNNNGRTVSNERSTSRSNTANGRSRSTAIIGATNNNSSRSNTSARAASNSNSRQSVGSRSTGVNSRSSSSTRTSAPQVSRSNKVATQQRSSTSNSRSTSASRSSQPQQTRSTRATSPQRTTRASSSRSSTPAVKSAPKRENSNARSSGSTRSSSARSTSGRRSTRGSE